MPNGYFSTDFLREALADGDVSQETLDTMVRRVLTPMFSFGLFDKEPSGDRDAVVTTDAHKATAREVATRAGVLLKNSDGILPLSTDSTHSIAVLGKDGGAGVQSVGGGSATSTSSGTVAPVDAIEERAGDGTDVRFDDGTDAGAAVDLARASDVAVVFAGYGEQEGTDLTGIDLPADQNALIQQVAAVNPNTVVVLCTGSAVTMPWLADVKGVIEQWYAGQEVGNAVAALLFGDANPSGKLPVTFPKSLADVPAHTTDQWPGNGVDAVRYAEGREVGYRWYDAQGIEPLFPFGYGLSYTSFAFSGLQLGAPDASGNVTVSATVTNTGDRAGAEVAQLYVEAPAAAGEPAHQLKGFQRVVLEPGARQEVSFRLTGRDFSQWDTDADAWAITPGDYGIQIGDSSRSLPLTGTVHQNGTAAAAATRSATASAGGTGAATVRITNPHGMSSRSGARVDLPVAAKGGTDVTFTAHGLPEGLSISRSGVISGTARTRGTRTVTVTAASADGARDRASFVWTVT